jgi:hypothetical protein
MAKDFARALSPVLAQADYLYPNTPMAVKPFFHLQSNPMAHPFDTSFSSNPTSCHYCPYTTTGAGINNNRTPPIPKTSQPEDILNTITPMQITTFSITNEVNLNLCTNPPPPPHPSSIWQTTQEDHGPHPLHH